MTTVPQQRHAAALDREARRRAIVDDLHARYPHIRRACLQAIADARLRLEDDGTDPTRLHAIDTGRLRIEMSLASMRDAMIRRERIATARRLATGAAWALAGYGLVILAMALADQVR